MRAILMRRHMMELNRAWFQLLIEVGRAGGDIALDTGST